MRSQSNHPLKSRCRGVARDDHEAVRLYRLAAAQGWPEAEFNLGVMYDQGRGVPQNYAEAVHWYRITADRGVADAQFNLGVLYANGKGVPQDYADAARWYRQATETHQLPSAEFNLAVLYDKGQGVPQDFQQAGDWHKLAADHGLAEAQFNRQSRSWLSAEVVVACCRARALGRCGKSGDSLVG